ncbi:hypothetical protein SAMN05444920_105629 [Nonomuraea solani]|uniref:Uncharacterized protein n=1 Tax=Nonomuraea solani TaxID=1144553 RepID=A0A1H6DKS5_9ACTN|nr:hypothetical protein [Nonomuraea solani]SEG86027.1 hypothetical protein SAMN05444920_105629 [Nonomuraea solani]
MSGLDPHTGEVLVPAKHVSDPRAKLPAAPLGDALENAAAERDATVEQMLAERPAMAKRAARMARGIATQPSRCPTVLQPPQRDRDTLERSHDLDR